ncbi:MAG: carboxylesterase/lipase family protein [Candidatus Binataceae bacterium]
MRFLLAAAAALVIANPPPARAMTQLPSPIVQTADGPVMGTVTDTISTFLGIPYAAPPVGKLRWMPPQPHAPWTTPRDATHYSKECPQSGSSWSEDCLYLNIAVPTSALEPGASPVPVMFWIHGGAFVGGSGVGGDPTKLITTGDVIVVKINYRLGALGFLAHSALSAESPYGASGNYGIMDQQFALKWVKRNIAAFGGDPGNVTIWGGSAGGVSVFSNLVSPLAKGRFRRAIVESGSYATILPSLASAESNGIAFANAVGCPDQTAACLRSVPAATLVKKVGVISGLDGEFLTPNVDGYVLPESIDAALADGHFNRVPVIDGTAHDEYRIYVAELFDLASHPMTSSQYNAYLNTYFGGSAPTVLAECPLADYPSPDLAFATVITDLVFSCQAHDADLSMAKYVRTRVYEFADENAPTTLPPVSFPYGAYHGSEARYLFGSLPSNFTPEQFALSAVMLRDWTSFARDGNPNENWPPLKSTGEGWIKWLRPDVSTREKLSAFSADHKCSFWQSLLTY